MSTRYWTEERIIEAVQMFAYTEGVPPKMREWTRSVPMRPCAETCVQRFGSWNATLAAAGLPTRPVGTPKRRVEGMDIGEPEKTIEVEPVRTPVPEPVELPAPVEEPEKVPA